MNISLILVIVGLVLVFFLAFKLLRGLFKAFISVIVIAIILIAVSGIIIYDDAMTLKKGFKNKTVVITHEDNLASAFKLDDFSISSVMSKEVYTVLSDEELLSISQKLSKENDSVDDLFMVIDQEIFYDDEIELFDEKLNFTQRVLDQIAKSNNLDELYDSLIFSSIELDDSYDFIELKTYIYYNLFKNKMSSTKGGFIIEGIKNKNITTNPELLSVKVLNFFPKNLMSKLVKNE